MTQQNTIEQALQLDDQFTDEFKQMAKVAFDEAVQNAAESLVFQKVSQYRDIIAEQGAIAIEKTLTEKINLIIDQVKQQVEQQLIDQYQKQLDNYQAECQQQLYQAHQQYENELQQIKDDYQRRLESAVESLSIQDDRLFDKLIVNVQDDLTSISNKLNEQGEKFEQIATQAASKYVKTNKVALVEAEKVWLGETIIEHFKNLYQQFDIKSPENINIYQKKIKQLSREKDDLYNQLTEQVDLNDKISEQLKQEQRHNIVAKAIESLTESQKSKVCTLLEQVQIDDINKFAQYAHKVADSINTTSIKAPSQQRMLTEQDQMQNSLRFGIVTDKPVIEQPSKPSKAIDPDVASVLRSLSRYKN